LNYKIGLSLFFLAGFFFIRIVGPMLVEQLKNRLLKVNSELVEKAPWYFKGLTFFHKIFSILCLLYIILIWTGFVKA